MLHRRLIRFSSNLRVTLLDVCVQKSYCCAFDMRRNVKWQKIQILIKPNKTIIFCYIKAFVYVFVPLRVHKRINEQAYEQYDKKFKCFKAHETLSGDIASSMHAVEPKII